MEAVPERKEAPQEELVAEALQEELVAEALQEALEVVQEELAEVPQEELVAEDNLQGGAAVQANQQVQSRSGGRIRKQENWQL